MESRLVVVLAIVTVAAATTSSIVDLAKANAQIITLSPIETLPGNAVLNLNISFVNGTEAVLVNESVTDEQSRTLILIINAILQNDNEALEELELAELPEEETTIEEEEDSDDSDNNGNDDGNDNGNDGDNGDSADELEEPELSPIPGPGPPVEGDGGEGGVEEVGLEIECHTDKRVYNEKLGVCIPANNETCPTVVSYGDGPCDEAPIEMKPDLS